MEIRVLGCYGNQLPGAKTTSLIINKTIALDAGAITSSLSLDEQLLIDDILLTHSHIDHIKDLGFLGDNIIGRKKTPVNIIAHKKTIDTLRKHFFNNELWPDFTVIPTPDAPVFKYVEIEAEEKFELDGLEIFPVQVPHPVYTLSYFLRDHKNSVLHVSDTGETEKIWEYASKEKHLKAIFLETSFLDEMEALAKASKHLTPANIETELKKIDLSQLKTPIDVYIYHLKPIYKEKLIREILKIKVNGFNIKLMEQGAIIKYV